MSVAPSARRSAALATSICLSLVVPGGIALAPPSSALELPSRPPAVVAVVPPSPTAPPSATATVAPLTTPARTPVTTPVPPPSRSAFRMDLGRRSDFVAQTNLVQCVGASMQMMLNMMDVLEDRTAATQLRLQRFARANSGPRPDGRERRGASVFGWAAGLEVFGGGRYMVVGSTTIGGALLEAARAMRLTGRPVGLLMWRGRHAWVMSGFRATKDPLVPGARVTSVIVEDPLYPRDSRTWGPSPTPGARLTVAALAKQFVPRRLSTRAPWLSGMYVVVIPYDIQHPHGR